MSYLNRYLLLLVFNLLNIVAFGAIISVAVINIINHNAPTNLIIYYGYTGLLSLALLLSEFRVPRFLNAQARFLFTYTGRGIILTYFGCIVYTSALYNVIACIFTVSLGVVYFVIAWAPVVPLQQGLLYNFSRWCSEGTVLVYNSSATIPDHEADAGAADGALYYAQEQKLQQTLPIVPPMTTAAATSTGAPLSYSYQQNLEEGLLHNNDDSHQRPLTGAIRHHRTPSQATTALELSPHYYKHVSAQSIVWPESHPKLEESHSSKQQCMPPSLDMQSLGIVAERSDCIPQTNSNNRAYATSACRLSNESFVYGVTAETRIPESTGDDYLDRIINSSCFAREVLDTNDDESIVVRGMSSSARSAGLAANVTTSDHTSNSLLVDNAGRRSMTSLGISSTQANEAQNSYVVSRPYTSAAILPSGSRNMSLARSVNNNYSNHNPSPRPMERISPPIPYRVFAPESQETFVQNLAHINHALAGNGSMQSRSPSAKQYNTSFK
ncbi:hypothetical protein BX070DRAFT_218281 [Coemansia spiralis]|nr:hypothetical protein BX070DRAFT_218281 [Coemansia spiralis]